MEDAREALASLVARLDALERALHEIVDADPYHPDGSAAGDCADIARAALAVKP